MAALISLCVAAAALWIAFRVRWWQRVHYQTLLGRSLKPVELQPTLLAVLIELDRVLSAHGVEYRLDAGTLLGAYRGGKFIPWDDDVDVCIHHRDDPRLWALRGQFQPPYRLIRISQLWSIDKVVPGLVRLWPCRTFLRLLDARTQLYVDIAECIELDGAQLGDEKFAGGQIGFLPLSRFHRPRDYRGEQLVIRRDAVYPLQTIEFEGRLFPAPRDPRAYLQAYYGEDLSPDHVWHEASGSFVPRPHLATRPTTSASEQDPGAAGRRPRSELTLIDP